MDNITKNENFCILPWTHLYYFTDGYVYPCPATAGDKNMRLGATTDDVAKLWNSDTLKDMRRRMLKNERIDKCFTECNGCLNSCKKYFGNDLLSEVSQSIANTKPDGEADINFIAWNIIESNKCNLKCVYCSGNYSCLHNADNAVMFTLPPEKLEQLYDPDNTDVKEIWFASGEPVIQDSTYITLNKLLQSNKTDIRIRFITNLTKTEYKGQHIYDILEKFKNTIVFGSWDLDGSRGEYIRLNSDSDVIKQTIKLINSKNITFYLQSVMSVLNLYYYPDFHRRLHDEGLVKKDNVRYYNLHYPEHFRYSILSKTKKDIIRNKLEAYKLWLGGITFDTYSNGESPLVTIDKIIECMYTGKWGHWGYDETNNVGLRLQCLRYLSDDINKGRAAIHLFKDALL